MSTPNRIMYSIDLDMWWQCRWATGSEKSMWPNVPQLLKEYYGSQTAPSETIDLTKQVLDLYDEYSIKGTFFILGEMAKYYPELVKEIHSRGHEVASHGFFHIDATILGAEKFKKQVAESKVVLENLIGEEVVGYRAPNLVLADWVWEILLDLGFKYDSSICPSRKFFGKYSGNDSKPNTPFILTHKDLEIPEIPIPAMPLVKLPAGSGIITRILGKTWSQVALKAALKKGDTVYYFHPYEIGERPKFDSESFYLKLFLRNLGGNYKKMLESMFSELREHPSIRGKDLYKTIERPSAQVIPWKQPITV